MFKNKKVFVSGGSGIIGKHLVDKLIKLKAKVLVGDIKPCPNEFVSKVIYRQGDLNFITKEELDDFAPEIFFHLAATFERTEESYAFYKDNFHNNIKLSNHLLGIIKDLKSIKKIIFASSYLIYDENLYQFSKPINNEIKLSEKSNVNPRNLIGMSKLAHETELKFLSKFKKNKLSIISARIFRGYGCNSRDIISRWIRSLQEKKTITLYRKEGKFDFIYAKDSAEGLIKLAKISNSFCVVNLGTGNSRKIIEIIDILKKYFKHFKVKEIKSNIHYESSKADIKKLNYLTKWSPKYNLEKAIHEMVKFEKNRFLNRKTEIPVNKNLLVTSFTRKKFPLLKSIKSSTKKIEYNFTTYLGNMKNDVFFNSIKNSFWKMPKSSKENTKKIINGCIKRKIGFILPTSDLELEYWSKFKKIYKKKNIHILISSNKTINLCNDKYKFFIFCKINKIPTPVTYLNIDKINAKSKFVVKERYSNIKGRLGINLKKKDAIFFSKKLKFPIFQEFISGPEISVDGWMDKFNIPRSIVLRKRNFVSEGESKISTVFFDKKLEKYFLNYFFKLKLNNHAMLQAKIIKKKLKIIECNPRIGGASTLSIKSGLDSFYWSLLEKLNRKIKLSKIKKIKQFRIPFDIYN